MMNDPLIGPKLKVKRAYRHIEDVASQIRTFYRTEPYPFTHWIEDDVDGVHQWLKARVTQPIPGDIATAVGDVIGNLRSSLDLLTRCLAVKNECADPRKTYFPFAGDLKEFETWGTQKKVKALSPDAVALIASLKPYKGGNDLLWALNRVRNVDEHNDLVPMGVAVPGLHGTMTMKPSSIGLLTFEAPRVCRFDKDQTATMLKFPRPAEHPEYEFDISVDVAFGDIEVVGGQPITAVLQQFASLTQGILLLFEKRFFLP